MEGFMGGLWYLSIHRWWSSWSLSRSRSAFRTRGARGRQHVLTLPCFSFGSVVRCAWPGEPSRRFLWLPSSCRFLVYTSERRY
jgi:hypothetical protein